MLYALSRTDGGVSIMGTLPIAAVIDGETFHVERIGHDRLVLIGRDPVAFAGPASDLVSNSIEGVELQFPDPRAEVAKFAPEQRDAIVSIHPITRADVPVDREYRNALEYAAGSIRHNMKKARDLHRDKMRHARAVKLAQLDIDYQRADEGGDAASKKSIAAKKQKLRDVTSLPEIDAATDIDSLRAVWPAYL